MSSPVPSVLTRIPRPDGTAVVVSLFDHAGRRFVRIEERDRTVVLTESEWPAVASALDSAAGSQPAKPGRRRRKPARLDQGSPRSLLEPSRGVAEGGPDFTEF